MSKNPLNLALHFLLELVGLFAQGYWGWTQHEGIWRWVLGLGVPVVTAAVWGIFRVPNDPGKPPVRVPGVVRFLLEVIFFGLAVGLLYAAHQSTAATILGVVVVLHYLVSYDRVVWLLKQ